MKTLDGFSVVDDAIQAVIDDAFPDRRIANITEAVDSGRRGNTTVRVQFTDGDYVFLKLRVDGDAARNRRETGTTRYARAHCGVRVPEVVAAELTANQQYLATAPLDGTVASTAWESPEQREAVARDIGTLISHPLWN